MMHHGMPFQQLSSRSHAKDKHGWQQALFCRKFMVACEARGHGHDSKQRHQVEGPIMQVKEWMREFWRCNLWSTRARKSQREDHHAGRKPKPGEARGHPGRPASPIKAPPGARLQQASSSFYSLFVCSRF
jgi:hypothetical protein